MTQLTTQAEVPLRLTGIDKRYGGVQALRGVDFEVRAGEVHALVGENGAGKSTLIKVASGAEAPDSGIVQVGAEQLTRGSTTAALAAGIATVYQEPPLFGELSVAENVFIGRELRRGAAGPVDWAAQRRRVSELLDRLGLDPGIADVRVADLPVGQQQRVSLANAIAHQARVLILDEPSAVLTDREIESLFAVVRLVTAEGVGVVYISHRLDELGAIADRITVLRDGAVVASEPAAALTVRRVAELMVGHTLSDRDQASAGPSDGPPVLAVAGLGRSGAFDGVSFEVRAGEIVALYGLVGSGTHAVARALYGIEPADSGTVAVHGSPVAISGPERAVRAGLAMVPGNRKVQGVFASKSVTFNIAAGNLRRLSRLRVWVDRRRERTVTRDLMASISIKAGGIHSPVETLSGGNQQKVVLARCLASRPQVLILEEPTQGVDVAAKDEIHGLIRRLTQQGSAVVMVSSDLREVQHLADRVLVVRRGRVERVFPRGAPQSQILAAAAGSEEDS
jgi:rhamnose transport system ATP-binding protein